MIKKIAAVFSLVGIAAIIAGSVHICRMLPQNPELEILRNTLDNLVDVKYRVPALAGIGLFILSGIISALSVLLSGDSGSARTEISGDENREPVGGIDKTASARLDKTEQPALEIPEASEPDAGILQKPIVPEPEKAVQPAVISAADSTPDTAYQILYLFQKEGRLIDLLMEDISELDDETLGGAIRPIHEGCRKILNERLLVEPIMIDDEGSEVALKNDYDSDAVKLTGNVPASGPFRGTLIHRGWRLKECRLPELAKGWKSDVIAPAEVEIS